MFTFNQLLFFGVSFFNRNRYDIRFTVPKATCDTYIIFFVTYLMLRCCCCGEIIFQDVYLIHIQQLISQLSVSTLQSLADINIYSRKTSACAMTEKYLNVRFHIRKVKTPSGYEL